MKFTRYVLAAVFALSIGVMSIHADETEKQFFYGVVSSSGKPVAGAMVTFYHGQPVHSLTVFSDEQGRYLTPNLDWSDGYSMRVRRVGWRDYSQKDLPANTDGKRIDIAMTAAASFDEVAAGLPANYWFNLVLEEFNDEKLKHEFKQQCTYCHQQGTPVTRANRTREEWAAVISNMAARGAIITHRLRDTLPDLFLKAYAHDNVMKKLEPFNTANGPLPVPSASARRAVIEEWDVGQTLSTQHDVMVYHRDGTIWTVDGPLDMIHKIDLSKNPDGDRSDYPIPRGDLKPGGVYWQMEAKSLSGLKEKNYLAPHSLQTAPDGRIWITLPKGNQLAGFDPVKESWEIVPLEQGINPHTLRFDARGRVWYTITATNHVGMFDPVTKEQKFVRLEAPDWKTALILRFTPFIIGHAKMLHIENRSADMDGVSMPMPYGIDVNPIDGSVWYSQLNYQHIGRIDPETLEDRSIKTPFDTPRRLRFDSRGGLWVPSYSEATLNHLDIGSGKWKSWNLPTVPAGSETPYAVAIDKSDKVWICGTQSDSIMRFDPETESFTVYPMPNRVTYTREIDFDDAGNMWTSHSNGPAWHVESGVPKVSRIDPDGAPDIDASGLFDDAGTPAL